MRDEAYTAEKHMEKCSSSTNNNNLNDGQECFNHSDLCCFVVRKFDVKYLHSSGLHNSSVPESTETRTPVVPYSYSSTCITHHATMDYCIKYTPVHHLGPDGWYRAFCEPLLYKNVLCYVRKLNHDSCAVKNAVCACERTLAPPSGW